MQSGRSGQLVPVSPLSYHFCSPSANTSSPWRVPRSAMSSPDYSDSREEEEMDIDLNENSPQTDSVLQRSCAVFPRCGNLALFSLSDLCISEQNGKPRLSHEQPCTSEQNDETTPSNEKMPPFEHEHDSSQLTCAEKCRLSSNSASLQHQQNFFSIGAKSCLLSILSLVIAVSAAAFFSVQYMPTTQCVYRINVEHLREELRYHVHGQHIAVTTVIEKLDEFNSNHRRQLVLSFHGWTGVGKNFMSSIIARHLPPANIHKFIVPLHFAHGTESDAAFLSEWIMSNVSAPACGLQLFIVDEIDKAEDIVVRRLRNTLSKLVLQVDTSCRAVFLLLTNDGATKINTVTLQASLNGVSREDLKLSDLILHLNSRWYTELVSAKLIDQVVPFLPLERRHVAQCTNAELKLREVIVTQQLIDDVVNSLTYFPSDVALFSRSGCRRITHIVDMIL